MRLLITVVLSLLVSVNAFAYSGDGGIWAQGKGDFITKNFKGDSTGFGKARDYCITKGGGVIQLGPGLEDVILDYPRGAGILVLKSFTTGWSAEPLQNVYALARSDTIAVPFPKTTAGLQAAIDHLVGLKGEVSLPPGELQTTTAIWLHSNLTLRGSGINKTVIKRASGSITDSDAPNSGAVLATSRYGANGTLSSATDTLNNIEILDLTIDGNSQAFQGLTLGTPHQAGILASGVIGLRIHRVLVKNTWRSGYMIVSCKYVTMSDVEGENNGDAPVITTNNCFDFYNSSATALTNGLARYYTLSNFRVKDTEDHAISITSVSDITISNGLIENVADPIEIQAVASAGSPDRIVIQGIVGRDLREWPIAIFNSTTYEYTDISISDCIFSGHPTLHDAGAITATTSTGKLKRFSVVNCKFSNINTKDTNPSSRYLVDFFSSTSALYDDLRFINLDIYGKPNGSATTYGMQLTGNIRNVKVENCRVKYVTASGFASFGVAGVTTTTERIQFNNCIAESVGAHGFVTGANTTTATINDIRFTNCGVIDAGLTTSGSWAINVQNTAAGVMNRVKVSDNWSRKISAGANFAGGFRVSASSGTIDDVDIGPNNFVGGSFTPYSVVGSPTNVLNRDTKWTTIFSALPSLSNASSIYCSDCIKATPCAGAGSGAVAWRINGAWDCNP